jgi:hypothetical protein
LSSLADIDKQTVLHALRIFGPNDLHNLAGLYQEQGRYAEAEELERGRKGSKEK